MNNEPPGRLTKSETTKAQTDNKGRDLKVKDCGHPYNWTFDKRGTVSELIQLKKIRLSTN